MPRRNDGHGTFSLGPVARHLCHFLEPSEPKVDFTKWICKSAKTWGQRPIQNDGHGTFSLGPVARHLCHFLEPSEPKVDYTK